MTETARDSQLERVFVKLRSVIEGGHRPFGSNGHEFYLNPPLSETEVSAFEREHQVELPSDYRTFITRIANGEAGPAYGMFPLAEALEAREYGRPDPLPPNFLKTPFPHTDFFNPWETPETQSVIEKWDELSTEERDRHFEYETAGTLVLCHEGCGYLHLLVVTGPTRGQMWIDGRVSDAGLFPLRIGFLDWYEKWLDSTLAGRSGNWWNDLDLKWPKRQMRLTEECESDNPESPWEVSECE